MASRTEAAGKLDVGARVDGDAVILIIALGSRDSDAVRRPNVEAIGVGTQVIGVAVGAVNSNIGKSECLRIINGEDLMRGVKDINILDRRVGQVIWLKYQRRSKAAALVPGQISTTRKKT